MSLSVNLNILSTSCIYIDFELDLICTEEVTQIRQNNSAQQNALQFFENKGS